MAYISMIFSAIASLGVLIGLISGIFFLVFSGLRWASRVRAMLYEEDLCRQKRLLVGNSYVAGSCPPGFTETKKEENSYGGGSILSDSSQKEFRRNDNTHGQNEGVSKEENTQEEGITADTVHIREFIEKMVESIIGGPLDGITVGKLSNHSAYLGMFTKYHSLLCQELAKLGFALQLSVVHKTDPEFNLSNSSLKRLIKRIVSEAMALPNIKELLCSPKLTEEPVNNEFENKSYEDILATAILNKVIEKFQTQIDKKGDNFRNRDKHYKSRAKMEKLKKKETEDDLLSSSDWSDSSRSDKLSLTIEEYIEEVTTAFEVSDDERSEISDFEPSVHHRVPFPESGRVVRDAQTDDENSEIEEQSSATELITSTNSWEENWLFQKKRLRSTPNAHHPVPVPMLVPNPSEDFRALVGGIDADDLSDMSDSDLILDDISENKTETITENQNNSISRTVETFENKNNQEQLVVFKLEKTNHNIDDEQENLDKLSNKVVVEETNETYKPEELSLKEIREEVKTVSSSLNSPEFLSQRDRDFSIEDFHLLDHCEVTPNETACLREDREVNKISSSNTTNKNSLRCSIAEREKEKWNNPVPLAENPYTLENIEKKERNKLEYFRIGTYTDDYIDFPENLSPDELEPTKLETLKFTRDYYVNASKYPSGDSSPSPLHPGYEQDFSEGSKAIASEDLKEFTECEMQDKNNNGLHQKRIANKKEFALPCVKELAKQFTAEGSKDLNVFTEKAKPSTEISRKSEVKQKSLNVSPHLNSSGDREPETDYSTIPVSKIVWNLQNASKSTTIKNLKQDSLNYIPFTSQMEIRRKDSNNDLANYTEKNVKNSEKNDLVRFNGKQVHSLTARSISKEFREGLKNNSYQKVFAKVDRSSSGGESEEGEIISHNMNTSPTPSIDLQNMKKFWEGIIVANSNSSKQK